MLEEKIYDLKTELWKELGITTYQWAHRKEDLLLWIAEFFNYELLPGKPTRILIKEIYGEYQPLPRKGYSTEARDALSEEKKKDYETFTLAALGTEFKPNSKSKIAREAIEDFGHKKYGHDNKDSVARRYVKPVFETKAETNGIHVWVYYSTYFPLEADVVAEWRKILEEEHISEKKQHKHSISKSKVRT